VTPPNTSRPILSLDARYYTDPAIFEIENTHLLAKTWQFAGHESQIKHKGEYFTFSIAGENLFCIRAANGAIHAFYNVCQHRAHELVSGTGQTHLLVCPYHAWTYELSGSLRSGPNIQNTPGLDPSAICLSSVSLENFHGFLFVNLDADAKPMETWFPNVRTELLDFVPHISELTPIELIEIPEKTNWKVSIENYSECYHCARNHPTFATGVIKAETGEYSSWFLWPLFSFQVYPGNVLNTYHWRTIDTDHVILYRGWYACDEAGEIIARQLALQDRETTVAEDILLVESIQRGLKSRGYTAGPLVLDPKGGVNSEHSILALHNWIREAINAYL